MLQLADLRLNQNNDMRSNINNYNDFKSALRGDDNLSQIGFNKPQQANVRMNSGTDILHVERYDQGTDEACNFEEQLFNLKLLGHHEPLTTEDNNNILVRAALSKIQNTKDHQSQIQRESAVKVRQSNVINDQKKSCKIQNQDVYGKPSPDSFGKKPTPLEIISIMPEKSKRANDTQPRKMDDITDQFALMIIANARKVNNKLRQHNFTLKGIVNNDYNINGYDNIKSMNEYQKKVDHDIKVIEYICINFNKCIGLSKYNEFKTKVMSTGYISACLLIKKAILLNEKYDKDSSKVFSNNKSGEKSLDHNALFKTNKRVLQLARLKIIKKAQKLELKKMQVRRGLKIIDKDHLTLSNIDKQIYKMIKNISTVFLTFFDTKQEEELHSYLKFNMLIVIANLHICLKHTEYFPFVNNRNGEVFDWSQFYNQFNDQFIKHVLLNSAKI